MRRLLSESATSGPVVTFRVVFAVMLLGPIVMQRLGLPGLIGPVHGDSAAPPIDLIGADDRASELAGEIAQRLDRDNRWARAGRSGDRLAAHQ